MKIIFVDKFLFIYKKKVESVFLVCLYSYMLIKKKKQI